MGKNNITILIIEDELKIIEVITAYLEKNNFRVISSTNGIEGLEMYNNFNPDLVILDLMLPGISGEEICAQIRKKSRVPIIMLSAKVSEFEKILGLEIGADDYISKPFSPNELVARVKSLLRRVDGNVSILSNIYEFNGGDLTINLSTHLVKVYNTEVILTPTEFNILALLVQNKNMVLSREQIIDKVFDTCFEGEDRTIDSHIKNLRSKIESTSNPKYIITVRGMGYKFNE